MAIVKAVSEWLIPSSSPPAPQYCTFKNFTLCHFFFFRLKKKCLFALCDFRSKKHLAGAWQPRYLAGEAEAWPVFVLSCCLQQPSLLVLTTFVPGFQAKWVCRRLPWSLPASGNWSQTPSWPHPQAVTGGGLLAEEGPEGPTENLWVWFQEQRQNKEAAELLAATRWQSIPRDAVAKLARKDAAHAVPGARSARVEWGAPGSDDPRGFQCRLFSTTPQALGVTVEATGFGFYFQISSDGSLYCNLMWITMQFLCGLAGNVDVSFRNSQSCSVPREVHNVCLRAATWLCNVDWDS